MTTNTVPPKYKGGSTASQDWQAKFPDSPLSGMLKQMFRYRTWAKEHWENVKVKIDTDDFANIDVQLDTSNFADGNFSVGGAKNLQAGLKMEHLQELQKAFPKTFIRLSSDNNDPVYQLDFETHQVVWEMHVKLAHWLCTYFLGVPYCDVWEDIAILQLRLGAFPGGAFYDKLAGDIYRLERRQHKKKNHADPNFQGSHDIYIMANTPLLLIPDEDDLAYVSPRETITTKGIYTNEEFYFLECVEKLACCYLRFQAFQFFHDKQRPKIRYAVSQLSLVTAMTELADLRLLADKHVVSDEYEAARIEWKSKPDSEKQEVRKGKPWETQYTTLKLQSDARLKYFVGAGTSNFELTVFSDESTRRRGLTSCFLGENEGVITNRPNRADQATAFCSWTDGIVLNEEKEKLRSLWKGPITNVDNIPIAFPFKPENNEYSKEWSVIA